MCVQCNYTSLVRLGHVSEYHIHHTDQHAVLVRMSGVLLVVFNEGVVLNERGCFSEGFVFIEGTCFQ